MKNEISVRTSSVPDGKTKFCFLFGSNIGNSPSPALHSAWFQKTKLNCLYLPMPLKEEGLFLDLVDNLIATEGFLGGNITLPFKNSILKLKSFHLTERVKAIQAANTIYRNDEGKWSLDNTDVKGVQDSVQDIVNTDENYVVLLLGGGGASASAIYSCTKDDKCLKVFCFTRDLIKTLERFPYLSSEKKLSLISLSLLNIKEFIFLNLIWGSKVLVINTLPIGYSNSEKNIFAMEFLIILIDKLKSENIFYFDMIYNDTETIKLAKKFNIKCINGERMLITQARESFYLWTGIQVKS